MVGASRKYKRTMIKKRRIKSKYSEQSKRQKKIMAASSNILALILATILIILVFNLTLNKKVAIKATPDDIAALNISYNDFAALERLAEKHNLDFPSLTAYYFVENEFFINKPVVNSKNYLEENFVKNFNRIKSKYKRKSIEPIEEMLETIMGEIVYFPIPSGFATENGVDYTYNNTWGAAREYGGDRTHQGADIVEFPFTYLL